MMRATILRSTLRAARSMAFRPAPISARFIQTSIPRRAEEAKSSSFSSDPSVDPQIQELRAKIESHEGCRQAIVRLAELMTKNGVDISKPPSTVQMMKLGMNSEIREAGANLMAQIKDAGVEMTPEIASQIFSKVVKDQ